MSFCAESANHEPDTDNVINNWQIRDGYLRSADDPVAIFKIAIFD